MEKQDRLIILFDYYGELLSDIQRSYFFEYYFENNSLAEIADVYKVSRNAVSKELKLAADKLNNYEEKLKLFDKDKRIKELLINIDNKEIVRKINDILDE